MDKNKDGVLSRTEIEEGMDKMLDVLKTDRKSYQDIMKSLDIDGNGSVDYTEFVTAAIDKVAMLNKENLKAAFNLIDVDKSGAITVDELKAAFDSHGEKDEHIW